jgi:tetratricopeptide (TPR) repeat protein
LPREGEISNLVSPFSKDLVKPMRVERVPDPDQTRDQPSASDFPSTTDGGRSLASTSEDYHDLQQKSGRLPNIQGYMVISEIAKGGMGRVYLGRDLTLDREVAIKILLPGANERRFVTEARITAKLPHPCIPPVHALGTLADGSPYLVLKFIRGQTLHQILSKRSSPSEDLPKFVQVFEQISQAVGYAHEQGVVHRDLKPLNVMVGTFGEVQVMDWGLAKDAGNLEGEPLEPVDVDADLSVTAPGIVMGTPGYMAPEQARGERADARADVFALGAILAAILTGKPAFVGTSARETIQKSADADLKDALGRLASSGADPDLVDLTKRCLGASPNDRPLDARAVAVEIAAYRTGVDSRLRRAETVAVEAVIREAEQRKRRRVLAKSAVAISLVLAIGLVISLWQMNRAVAAEGRAKKETDAKAKALDALTDAYGKTLESLRTISEEVFENQMAKGGRLTDESKRFLQRIVKQFDAFAAVQGHDLVSRHHRAEGRMRVARMRHRLGDSQAAITALKDVVEDLLKIAEEYPEFVEPRRNLAVTWTALGDALFDVGSHEEAERSYSKSKVLFQSLHEKDPRDEEASIRLAIVDFDRAKALENCGRRREALEAYAASSQRYEQLIKDHPSKAFLRHDWASCMQNQALLLDKSGRKEDAAPFLDKALAQFQQAVDMDPSRQDWRLALAKAEDARADFRDDQGNLADPVKNYTDRVARYRRLNLAFPSNLDFRELMATAYFNLGVELEDAKKCNEALTNALTIYRRLCEDFPDQRPYREHVARTQTLRGERLAKLGRRQEGKAALEEGLEIRRRLVLEMPRDLNALGQLADSLNEMSEYHFDLAEWDAAERCLVESISIEKRRLAESPDNAELRAQHSRVCSNLGAVRMAMGRTREAEEAFAANVDAERKLAVSSPSVLDYQLHLQVALRNWGASLSKLGRTVEAETAFRECVAIARRLTNQQPDVRQHRFDAAASLRSLAIVLKQRGAVNDADAVLAEATVILRRLVEEAPAQVDSRIALAMVLVDQAKSNALRREFRLASSQLGEADAQFAAAAKVDPDNNELRSGVRARLLALTGVQAGLLETTNAIQTAHRILMVPGEVSTNAYDAACALALCIPIVESHASLTAEQRLFAVKSYGDEAMKLLLDAKRMGFADVDLAKRDSDLSSLRQREDFKRLLAALHSGSVQSKAPKR